MTISREADHPVCHRCGDYLTNMWELGYECSRCSEEAKDRQNEIDRQEAAALPFLAPKPTGSDEERARKMRREVSEYVGGSPTPLEIMIATIAAVRAEERAAQATQIAALEKAHIETMAELIYLRRHGFEGVVWWAKESKDVWRDKARAALEMSGGAAKRPHPS